MLFSLLDSLVIGTCTDMNFTYRTPNISIATLASEIRNIDSVKLQQDITKENGIKFILASSKCHVPYIYLFYN